TVQTFVLYLKFGSRINNSAKIPCLRQSANRWPRYLPAVGILANGAETTSHIERRYLPSGRYHRPT
ncbi:MAG: hypothetical protein M9911_10200, partial [Saprospiraceae bacterium]|nr:hypothetical protein [Saprospiraceae bacterium]